MLRRLTLRNFKAHQRLEMDDIPNIAVLLGENNSGKSSVLHSIAVPRYEGSTSTRLPIGSPDKIVHKGESKAEIRMGFEEAPSEYRVQVQKGGGIKKGWSGSGPSGADPPGSVFFISRIRTIPSEFPQKEIDFVEGTGAGGVDTGPALFYLKNNHGDIYSEIQDWLKEMGMGVTLVGSRVQPPGDAELRPQTYGKRVNIFYQGDGVASVLPILTQGKMCREGDILLIEEPELHLYRGTLGKLWDFFGELEEEGIQVILTTHSVDLLFQMKHAIRRKSIPSESRYFKLSRSVNEPTEVDERDPLDLPQAQHELRKDAESSEI